MAERHTHGATVLVEQYRRERIEREHEVPSPFRLIYLESYAEATRTWLHGEAEVIDTTHRTSAQAAQQIAEAVKN
jgi:hypothetical protein